MLVRSVRRPEMTTPRLPLLAALLILWLCAFFVRSVQAQTTGFVYATVAGPLCASGHPCAPAVHVYEATSAELVATVQLPAETVPAGIAVSRDGAFIYVSVARTVSAQMPQVIEGSMTIIDGRRHRLIGTFPTGEHRGPLAVSADSSRVVIATTTTVGPTEWKGSLAVFDTSSRTIVQSAGILPGIRHVAIGGDPERVVVFGLDPTHFAFVYTARLTSLELSTLDLLATDARQDLEPGGIAMTADGTRVHALYRSPFGLPSSTRLTFDTSSLAPLSEYSAGAIAAGPIELADGTELLAIDDRTVKRFSLTSGASNVVAGLPGPGSDLTLPMGGDRAFALVTDASAAGNQLLVAVDLRLNRVVDVVPLATSGVHVASTPAGAQACRDGLDSNFLSFPASGGTGQIRLTTPCYWEASSDASWVRLAMSQGTGSTVVDVSVEAHAFTNSRTATLTIEGQRVTITQAGTASQPPFGSFDTPGEGALTISGSIPVTGWALDDIGVARVRIYRDAVAGETGAVYLGDAAFVAGARPDVEAILPALPFASRAGWGLMLLTNTLPSGGNGMFRLHAVAEDVEGHRTLLGTRTILIDNASAALPFGAIDTPGQGDLISGIVYNWGWALTPGPATIPTDGTTIDVMIDGAFAGHPVYGLYRQDIASLFPGFTNAQTAVGYYLLDTRRLQNGQHTISWIVRDSQGRAQGIGSRYFHVFNP